MNVELKAVQRKLETEKGRADLLQTRVCEKDLELQKSKDILNVANKNLKLKDAEIKRLQESNCEKENLLKAYASIPGDLSNLSKSIKQENQHNQHMMLTSHLAYQMMLAHTHVKQDADENGEEDMEDVEQDGEIIDDENNMEQVKHNEFQQKVKEVMNKGTFKNTGDASKETKAPATTSV